MFIACKIIAIGKCIGLKLKAQTKPSRGHHVKFCKKGWIGKKMKRSLHKIVNIVLTTGMYSNLGQYRGENMNYKKCVCVGGGESQ